jgi:hypothetical protein
MASHEWWFFADLARFKSEREGLAGLAARSAWLTLGELRVNSNARVEQEFEIDLGHRQIALVLRYPDSFPYSPPSVFPRDEQQRLSGHQYGPGGELCLEYRADNWSPEIMGWQLVQSAYDLLSEENPGPGERGEVRSAHAVTDGQRTRTTFARLVMDRSLADQFRNVPPGVPISGEAFFTLRSQNIIFFITSLGAEGCLYNNERVPELVREDGYKRTVRVIRIDPAAALPASDSREAFVASAIPLGWQSDDSVFVVLKGEEILAYSVYSTGVNRVTVLPPESDVSRSGDDHEPLSGKRIGVIGCGSLGSKVAVMLARAGITNFVLVDDDLFLSGNVERHDLDWRDVGLHKVIAVSEKLQRIRSTVKTNVFRRQLGGQESSKLAEEVLSALSHCDLIFDATANPVASNILSMFETRIPLVWAEVYAGGVGGMIARHRSGKEPSMDLMRRAVDNWFRGKNVPMPRADVNYEQRQGDVTMVADDADVTAIAAPATRLAIDTLLAREPSYFPNSVYVIGLAPCPLFEQPFVTYPIDLPEAPPAADALTLSDEERREELTRIVDMFQRLASA